MPASIVIPHVLLQGSSGLLAVSVGSRAVMGSSVLHMLLLPPPRLRALLADTLYAARTGGVVATLAAADAAVVLDAKRTGFHFRFDRPGE